MNTEFRNSLVSEKQVVQYLRITKSKNSKTQKKRCMCDKNNNNETDEERTVVPSEFMISDDEDNISIKMSLMNKMLKVKSKLPRISKRKENRSSSRSKRSRNLTNYSWQFWSSSVILIIYNILAKLILILIHLICSCFIFIYQCFPDFTTTKRVLKNTNKLFKVYNKKLFTSCLLNKLRKRNSREYSDPQSATENDSLMTKHSWFLFLIGLISILIYYIGYRLVNPQTSIQDKYQIGASHIKELKDLLKYNLYNLPGSACMVNENDLYTNTMVVKRWLYCFLTLPYRISRSGFSFPINEKESIENNLQKITDWRLKRNIRRLQMIIKDIRSKIFIIDKKTNQAEMRFQYLKCDGMNNLTHVISLESGIDKLENEKEDFLKKLKDLSTKTNTIYRIKQNLEKEKFAVQQSLQSTSKKLTKNIEKRSASDTRIVEESNKNIKNLESKAKEKLKYSSLNPGFDNLKNDIFLIQNSNKKWLTELPKLGDIVSKIRADIEILSNYIMNRFKYESQKVAQKNKELSVRMEHLISLNEENLNKIVSKQKLNITEIIKSLFITKYKQINNYIIEESCPKIQEYVQMTILSTMTMDHMKDCGVVNGVVYSNETCLKNMFNHFNENSQELKCCRNKSEVLQRINESLETFNSDYLGLADYALVANGGQILEAYTTTSIYYRNIEENNGSSFLSLNAWKPWLLFSKKIIHSVNFLNTGKVQTGRCWKFKGNSGSTIIKLAQMVLVTTVTLEHIHPNISLTKNYMDAPRQINIHSLLNENDSPGILLGDFYFVDLEDSSIQQFILKELIRTQFIKFTIKSNHGANYTCVYRLRIHGHL